MGYGGAFEKVGQRRSLVISTVCAAGLVKPTADGQRFEDVRLALGGIGPVPVRLGNIEDHLIGQAIAPGIVHEVSEMTEGLINSRTRRAYRGDVVRGFIRRALHNALTNAGVGLDAVDEQERQVAHV